MSDITKEKREELALEFITGAKEEFNKHIQRDTVDEVTVSDYTEKEGSFDFAGSLGVTSPTGKLKTFGYTAKVEVDENGNCSFSNINVKEL